MERENVEWTNGWREDANNPLKRRWLLIGDSVARQWRGRLQEFLKVINISVDFFATSLHLEDPAFFKELRNFLSYDEYKYELVLINWGGHHGWSRKCSDNQETYISYKTHYENLLNYIEDVALPARGGGRIVIINTTPEVLSSDLGVLDESKNIEIATRNKIAYEISVKNNIPYINHFDLVIKNKSFFKYGDHVHFFSHNEYIILVKTLLDALVQFGIINNKVELLHAN